MPFRRVLSLALTVGLSACHAPPAGVSRVSEFLVPLWSGPAPVGDGTTELCATRLQVYLPSAAINTRAAIVVCPGGGYIRHVMDREGFPIADWLTSKGIAAVLLEYRLPEGRPMVPLLDAQRALRTVRANAAAWEVDPSRVGILGFSAGGHVASTAGTHFDPGRPADPDPVARFSSRPDFQMLVYPVVTMGEKTHALSKRKLLGEHPTPEMVRLFSNEEQVTPRTPPAFLAHAKDDEGVVPDNSRDFVRALKAHGVEVEYLELPSGNHGLNGCKGPLWEQWKAASLAWLALQGVLPLKMIDPTLMAPGDRATDLASLPAISLDFKVEPYLRAAVRLQGLGRAAAVAELVSSRTQDQAIVLCRMLFTARSGSMFRQPAIGVPSLLGGTEAADWPLEPIELVDGIPFLVTRGYTIAGFPEPSSSYLRYCLENCDWSPVRYGEINRTALEAALAKLLASSKWKKPLDGCDRKFFAAQIGKGD